MPASLATTPAPENEPVRTYAPGTRERATLKTALDAFAKTTTEAPCVIGARQVHTGDTFDWRAPHDHDLHLATVHAARAQDVTAAIAAAARAAPDWAAADWEERAAVFLRAAELAATVRRDELNAATMLGQSKTVHQAEIDAACELIDFLRFNVHFYEQILADQPPIPGRGVWNRLDWRPLEGFVLAMTPFNFTAIAGNLPTAPALCGNTVLWKPSEKQVLAAQVFMDILRQAGLPDGVINLVHGDGALVSDVCLDHPDFAGLHFTGSIGVLRSLWSKIGERVGNYRNFPRIVGETGGKDFVVAHASADTEALATAIVRGAFEYQGQKCSAVSRVYVPTSGWADLEERLVDTTRDLRVGDVRDFRTFVAAVIDEAAFRRHEQWLRRAHEDADLEVLVGGTVDDEQGWFVAPTIVRSDDPEHDIMQTELFGPIVSVYVYDEDDWQRTLDLVDRTSPFALTGAVFADDRRAVTQASERLRHAAGNFYVNDKPTGSVVGQQPFGGARASGTNDKAGSPINLLRWLSARSIKESFAPPTDHAYPSMGAE